MPVQSIPIEQEQKLSYKSNIMYNMFITSTLL